MLEGPAQSVVYSLRSFFLLVSNLHSRLGLLTSFYESRGGSSDFPLPAFCRKSEAGRPSSALVNFKQVLAISLVFRRLVHEKRTYIVNNCKLSYPVQYSCCCCHLVVSHLTLPAAWWDWLQLLCWVYCQRTAQGSESSACKNKQRTHLQSLLWKLYTRATYFKVDFWYITICLLTCS